MSRIGERFLSNVELQESGCWLWVAGRFGKDGYGAFRQRGAHRAAYEMFNGPIPEGMLVCHTCDVKNCVNPDHLFLGTPLDNMQDKVRKGRHKSTPGESNVFAKLTEDLVLGIRAAARVQSHAKVAKIFGVNQSTVTRIVNRKTWAHI